MKKLMIAVLAMGVSNAMADGFVCETLDGALTVKVYNRTDADEGTRNASVMILSDNTVQYGRKTIAKFDADNQVLDNRGAGYIANVDLRYNDSGRGGENIGGTKLAQLDAIALDIDFSYGAPMKSGEIAEGVLTLIKRNGAEITIDVDCERYLKN
jgi:uncharacterized protein YdbL (DUF1318 family)